jgi:hypothetical protein
MRRTFASLALALIVSPVFAGEQKKEESRFKVSVGVSTATVTGKPPLARAGALDYDFRSTQGLLVWHTNFRNEYLVPHGAVSFPFDPPILARCCANGHDAFRTGPGGFTGQVGDEYTLWERGTLRGVTESGMALGGSFEYRAAGPLWVAFSVQSSRGTALEYTEAAEFFRLESSGFVPCSNCPPGYPRTNLVEFSRNRVVRDVRQSYRSASFAGLAKVDLTRGNRHWSIMPQAGVDLLVSRETFATDTEFSRWKIYYGEGHGSAWAAKPDRVGDLKHREIRSTRYVFRPVAGLALELYPAGKENRVAFVADGRYHFGGTTSYEHPSVREPYYWGNAPVRRWTLALGALVRF